jgi:tetratricopeptide (TPR) repeat protein
VLNSLFFALACGPALAVDTEPSPPPAATRSAVADPLAAARGFIAAKNWAAALAELKRVNANGSASGDANWNNLMGYSLRKQATPDLDGAQRYYDVALRIDPKHQGALEYSGELALMKGDLAAAEAKLAALSRLCSSPCEALDALKASIASVKAGGKPLY